MFKCSKSIFWRCFIIWYFSLVGNGFDSYFADLDDLDILASLADSDLEFNEDDDIGEAIRSGNASPKSAATQQRRQQENSMEHQQTSQEQCVKEMAGKINNSLSSLNS